MKQLLFTMTLICIVAATTFAQPNSVDETNTAGKDSTVINKKIYFPATLYKDSVAFEKAISKLAIQFLSVYKEPNKRKFYNNSGYANLIAGNYSKSIEMIDSMKKVSDDNTYGIYMKPYALAKMKESSSTSFNELYKKEFTAAFNQLSFSKRIVVSVDTNFLKYMTKDYNEFKDKLKDKNTDSLDLDDARMLIRNFTDYSVINKVFYIVYPITNAPQYQSLFPAIKSSAWGVVPVQGIDEFIDTVIQYKLLFELTGFAMKDQQDSIAKKDINGGLNEVARVLNLHVANGVPKKNIDAVIVVHSAALFTLLNNEKYKKKYDIDNPNIALIKELQDFGTKIIVCGQAMTFLKLEKEELVPGIKLALTAQTVLSTYQLKGYVYYDERVD